jgi:predicted secreted Zn-dependent protease
MNRYKNTRRPHQFHINLGAALRHVLIVAVAGLTLMAGIAQADPPTIKYYEVIGSTVEELRREIEWKGPRYDGRRAAGLAEWSISWTFRYAPTSTGCELTEINPRLEGTITLPRWVAGKDRAADTVIAEWHKFVAALRVHEDGHYAYGMQAEAEVRALGRNFRVRGDCSRIIERFNADARAIVQKHVEANEAYDRDTRYGQTQGVVFGTASGHTPRAPAVDRREESAAYMASVREAVESLLTYPPGHTGKRCAAVITQSPSGDVLGLRLARCDSRALATAVQLAILDASPLPKHPDARHFERLIHLEFVVP